MNKSRPVWLRALKAAMMRYVPLMMTCREFDAFLHDYVAGSLSAGQRRRFLFHLSLCLECREHLAAYERNIKLGKAVYGNRETSLFADAPEALIQAILDARRG